MDILNQLGQLVLGSVPTMVLFVLLIVLYNVLVESPLKKMLDERRVRTSGAVEQARQAMSAAEAETTVYEDKLRAARQQMAARREAQVKQWQAEREQMLGEARTQAQGRVRTAREQIDASSAAARDTIAGATEQLSESILRAILPASAAGQGAQQA